MTFNILLTGVGGEGVLLTSVIVARAAAYDGYEVGGIQLHGLAQRGGSIPTYVRFGKKPVHSPTIPKGEADLIIGLETAEAARACEYADRKRTDFLIDTYKISPIYSFLYDQNYPSMEKIEKMIEPFAKSITIVDASEIVREKLGSAIYGNVMALGVALKKEILPISRKSIQKSLENTLPRGKKQNRKAFKMGLEFEG